MRLLAYLTLACICAGCWYVAFTHPMWALYAFAFSWGSVLVIDTVLDVRDALARRRAERDRLPRATATWGN